VLARILAEIKLLGTDLGRIAMSAAIVNVRHVRADPVLATSISEVALRESGPLPRAGPTRHRAVCSRHSLCREGALGRALPAPLGRQRPLCREPGPKLSAQLCREPT
jgi:hypothetical protein